MMTRALPVSFLILLAICSISAQNEKRPAYAILVDNSGSLRTQLQTEIALAKEIVRQVPDGSFISLFGFATDMTHGSQIARIAVGIQCTTDRELIGKQLDHLITVPGQTTLLHAIHTAARRLSSDKPTNCGEFSERNLVMITDGEDRASALKPTDLISSLEADGVKVFAVGLIAALSRESGLYGKSDEQKAKEFLERITKETGGTVVFPKKKQTVEETVNQLLGTTTKSSK